MPETTTKKDGLKKQRSSYKAVLTKLANYANEISDASTDTLEAVRVKISRAHEVLEKIVEVESLIFEADPSEESKLLDAEDVYYNIVAKLNEWIRKRGITESHAALNDSTLMNTSVTHHSPGVKLPKLQLPTFSGDYTEWQSFYDLFASTIHERESIPPAQKFQYLKGLLKGEAYNLVKHFQVTEANYIEALQKLRQRYDRKRHTINAFIRTFMDQPCVNSVTAANIRKLLDTSDEVIRGLKALGEKAEARDPWLIYLLVQKLDDETRSLWARANTEEEFPTIQKFFNFLVDRTDALESLNVKSLRQARPAIQQKPTKSLAAAVGACCIACRENEHRLSECDTFKAMPVEDRRKLVGDNKRCFNCLNTNHAVFHCRVKVRCRYCFRKHHSLLHLDDQSAPTAATHVTQPHDDDTTQVHHSQLQHEASKSQTILPTALIHVVDNRGTTRSCRALLDTGSQASFVTEALVQKLGLKRTNGRMIISGIGQTSVGKSNGETTLEVTSRFNSKRISIKVLILPTIASLTPSAHVNVKILQNLPEINFADPRFDKPQPIDILLGADIVFNIFLDGIIKLGDNLIAQNTQFGWIVSGRCEIDTQSSICTYATSLNVDETLQKFWEVEEYPKSGTKFYTAEEDKCEEWFKATTKRAADGKFITKLPFKDERVSLGSTYHLALSRLLSMEKRFKKDPNFHYAYKQFIEEYLELGHMEQIHLDSEQLKKEYILPHHGVIKESSSTTKLRVVFDASAKINPSLSLNDNLMVGPVIQSSLLEIILRFRQHRYVLVGDIEKMYRQVWMDNEDTRHQMILWRDEKQQICPYILKTITYGTASASFMATRCLKELAQEFLHKAPDASRAIEHDIYVDDLMTGADTLIELSSLKDDILKILQSGGFKLRKMSSNDQTIRDSLKSSDEHIKKFTEFPEPIKLLGIGWKAQLDHFVFHVQIDQRKTHTKRSLLSEASRIFDPLGLLSPIIIRIKILFQNLWLRKLDWDESLPPDIHSSWNKLRNELRETSEIQIPRKICEGTSITIHGFCDASKWAYAAVIYARSQSEQGNITRLICAKTKVAPIKTVSLPRLELMG